MARTVYGPPRNNAYVAMLGLAVFGMVISCAMLGLEVSGYDPVPAFQAVSLPKIEPRAAAPTGGSVPAPANPGGGTAKADTPRPAATPAPAPAVVPQLPKIEPPAVAKVVPTKVEPPKVEDLSKRGPRPGFLLTAPPTIPAQSPPP